ncbi:Uncharacterised protein [Vibrio cholerae]|nr:Uncharacterised protein [Vibrio cholerae]
MQHHRFFKVTHHRRANRLLFGFINLNRLLDDALT